jgi:NifU-like protein involved in Fe-S cluster formation
LHASQIAERDDIIEQQDEDLIDARLIIAAQEDQIEALKFAAIIKKEEHDEVLQVQSFEVYLQVHSLEVDCHCLLLSLSCTAVQSAALSA